MQKIHVKKSLFIVINTELSYNETAKNRRGLRLRGFFPALGGRKERPSVELIKMQMLGGFAVSVGEVEICGPDCRKGQLWSLLQYLVTFRHREIPASELQAALWPKGTGNPSNALKNLVYRVRTAFEDAGISDAKQLILCKRGVYRFNSALPLEADTELFEAAAAQALRAEGPQRIPLLKRAAILYSGDYLPGEDRQSWAAAVREDLHGKYAACALPLMEYLDGTQNWSALLQLATHSTDIDPFDAPASYYQLRALLGLEMQPKALEYYNYLQNLYYRERGESLPEQVRGLYLDIIRHMNNIEIDIAKIKQDISEKGEYEIFKELYRVEARAAARTGQKMFLGLLTLTDEEGSAPTGRARNRAMDHLEKTLVLSLRRGDVVARFSATQYVALMATRTYENGLKVIGRVERRFRAEYRGRGVRLATTLQPIDVTEG